MTNGKRSVTDVTKVPYVIFITDAWNDGSDTASFLISNHTTIDTSFALRFCWYFCVSASAVISTSQPVTVQNPALLWPRAAVLSDHVSHFDERVTGRIAKGPSFLRAAGALHCTIRLLYSNAHTTPSSHPAAGRLVLPARRNHISICQPSSNDI